ncbi:MAG: hypothetical protein COY80_05360 [Candidatus Pacebacteria bacterium CG_4_10_14_0_8_um_filter_42_14]|nr:MAG: hypothetical protein COY80_05360 [Candidatus Pacebacteria bacterium CG_4_10_14_0_8_um_filter_42_14]
MRKIDDYLRTTYSSLFQILRKRTKILVPFLAVSSAISLISVLMPYLFKLQIDYLETQALKVPGINNPILIFLVLLIIPSVIEIFRLFFFDYLVEKLRHIFEFNVRVDVEKMIWNKLQTFDLGFFQSGRNDHLVKTAFDATSVINRSIYFVTDNLNTVITLIAIIPLLYLVNWKLILIVFGAAIGQLMIDEYRRKISLNQGFVDNYVFDKSWVIKNIMENDFGSLKEVGAGQQLMSEYFFEQKKAEDFSQKNMLYNQKLAGVNWVIDNIFTIVANLFVASEIFAGNISIGTFTMTISYISQINVSIGGIIGVKSKFQDLHLDILKLNFILSLKSRLITSHGAKNLVNPKNISLRGIGFAYPSFYEDEKLFMSEIIDKLTQRNEISETSYIRKELDRWRELVSSESSNEKVLHDVSVNIPRGKLVALLGRNGSGKTTITKIMMHSFEADEGEVLIDGNKINDFNRESVSSSFAYLQQAPFILDRFSIRSNLLLGVGESIGDSKIWETLEALGLKRKLESSKKGLESIIGEDILLSGGQQQLLVMARTMLQRRPFVIFDEGSSQLDIEKERRILDLLHTQKNHSAILFITHRISVARKADYIYMIDDGRIVEEGTHYQLLNKKGLYFEFWRMQDGD